MILNNLH